MSYCCVFSWSLSWVSTVHRGTCDGFVPRWWPWKWSPKKIVSQNTPTVKGHQGTSITYIHYRWWFQIVFFSTPKFVEDYLVEDFSRWVVQPPTRQHVEECPVVITPRSGLLLWQLQQDWSDWLMFSRQVFWKSSLCHKTSSMWRIYIYIYKSLFESQ